MRKLSRQPCHKITREGREDIYIMHDILVASGTLSASNITLQLLLDSVSDTSNCYMVGGPTAASTGHQVSMTQDYLFNKTKTYGDRAFSVYLKIQKCHV